MTFPHWIIIDRKKGKVWQGDRDSPLYATEAEAIREFNFQRSALKQGMKTGYVVERVDEPGGSASRREQAKRREVDSLERAAAEIRMPHADN